MNIFNNISKAFKKIPKEFKALSGRICLLEKSLKYLTPKVSVERSDPDSDGIYRCITYRRNDGSLIQVTKIEHDITLEVCGGIYNKRVMLIYNVSGTVVEDVTLYHLKYDETGNIISETLIP